MPYTPSLDEKFNGATYLTREQNDTMLTLFERGVGNDDLMLIYPLLVARHDADLAHRAEQKELKFLNEKIAEEAIEPTYRGVEHTQRVYNKFKLMSDHRISELIKIIERDREVY